MKNDFYDNIDNSRVNKQLAFTVRNHILPQIKDNTIILAKKDKSHSYYLNNHTLKSYLIIIKSLDPFKFQQDILKLIFDLINNLKSREFHVREKARAGFSILIEVLGVFIIPIIICELTHQLHSGYQKFILSHVLYYIITKHCSSSTIIYDYILLNTHITLLDDIFTEISEDSQIASISSKYPESKMTKSLESIGVLTTHLSQSNSFCLLIFSLWKYLSSKVDFTTEANTKLTTLFNKIVTSLKVNTQNDYSLLHSLGFSMITINYSDEKAKKKIIKNDSVIVKGSSYMDIDSFTPISYNTLEEGKYVLQKGVNNFNRNTDEMITENRIENNKEIIKLEMCSLGFEILMLYISKQLAISSDNFDYDYLNDIVKLCIFYIRNSKSERLLNKCFKLINLLIKHAENIKIYDIIKPNVRLFVAVLIKQLPESQDVEFTQTILKSLGEMISRKLDFIEMSDNQIISILSYTKLSSTNIQLRTNCFSLILNLLRNKVFHKDIFKLIEYVIESYIECTNSESNIKDLSSKIIINFFSDYIVTIAEYISNNANKHSKTENIIVQWQERCINILAANTESDNMLYKMNSIQLINSLITISNVQIEKTLLEVLIYRFISLFIDEKISKEIKAQLELFYSNVFKLVDERRQLIIFKSLHKKLDQKISQFIENPSQNFKISLRAYLDLFNVMIKGKVNISSIISDLIKSFNELVYSENSRTEDYIQKYVENCEVSGEIIKLTIPFWDVSYLLLVIFENLITINASYINYNDDKLMYQIYKMLEHPNFFIKSVSVRLINRIFTLIRENSKTNVSLFDNTRKINVSKAALLKRDFINASNVNSLKDDLFTYMNSYKLKFREKTLIEYILPNLSLLLMQPSLQESTLCQVFELSDKILNSYSQYSQINNSSIEEYIAELTSESLAYLKAKNSNSDLISIRVTDVIKTIISSSKIDNSSLSSILVSYLMKLNNINDDKQGISNDLKNKVTTLLSLISDKLGDKQFDECINSLKKENLSKMLNKKRKNKQ